jgi:hypothetical protein
MRELLLKTQQEVHDTNTKWNKVIDCIKEIDMSGMINLDLEFDSAETDRVKNEIFINIDRLEYKRRIDLIIKLAFNPDISKAEDEVDNDQ